MAMSDVNIKRILSAVLAAAVLSSSAHAYWIWTPETKKFVNPKHTVKDSPKEQYDWAMSFYEAKDYTKAAQEFEKLARNYEYSEYATRAQYYAGLCYENMGKYYVAFENYQKTIDNYPNTANIDEIIARQFNIANIYASKDSPKVMGTDIMTSYDRAIEIYKKVVSNAPYGQLADQAQFKLGETLKAAERFDEAIEAFKRVLDEYPDSELYEKARYEVAYSAYRASLKPAYDAGATDKAIQSFEDFRAQNSDAELIKEADETVQRLKDKAAEKIWMTADFYEKQKRYQSAIIYYQELLSKFPGSIFTERAKAKIALLKTKKGKK
jgi:outer membrane protein assembly factor BamD